MSELPMHYTTCFHWLGTDSDGQIAIKRRPDMPTGSPHTDGRYCPEHMLVAAAETCLGNTVVLIAARSKLKLHAYRSSAEGELEFEKGAGYRFKRIVIKPVLTVDAGSKELAARVVDKSHRACLIARSLNCPVDIEPAIETR